MKSLIKNTCILKKALLFLSCLLFVLPFISCSPQKKVLIVVPTDKPSHEDSPDVLWMELRFYFTDDEITESRIFIAYTNEGKAEYYYAQHTQLPDLRIEGNVVSYSLDITSYDGISADELMKIYMTAGYRVRLE